MLTHSKATLLTLAASGKPASYALCIEDAEGNPILPSEKCIGSYIDSVLARKLYSRGVLGSYTTGCTAGVLACEGLMSLTNLGISLGAAILEAGTICALPTAISAAMGGGKAVISHVKETGSLTEWHLLTMPWAWNSALVAAGGGFAGLAAGTAASQGFLSLARSGIGYQRAARYYLEYFTKGKKPSMGARLFLPKQSYEEIVNQGFQAYLEAIEKLGKKETIVSEAGKLSELAKSLTPAEKAAVLASGETRMTLLARLCKLEGKACANPQTFRKLMKEIVYPEKDAEALRNYAEEYYNLMEREVLKDKEVKAALKDKAEKGLLEEKKNQLLPEKRAELQKVENEIRQLDNLKEWAETTSEGFKSEELASAIASYQREVTEIPPPLSKEGFEALRKEALRELIAERTRKIQPYNFAVEVKALYGKEITKGEEKALEDLYTQLRTLAEKDPIRFYTEPDKVVEEALSKLPEQEQTALKGLKDVINNAVQKRLIPSPTEVENTVKYTMGPKWSEQFRNGRFDESYIAEEYRNSYKALKEKGGLRNIERKLSSLQEKKTQLETDIQKLEQGQVEVKEGELTERTQKETEQFKENLDEGREGYQKETKDVISQYEGEEKITLETAEKAVEEIEGAADKTLEEKIGDFFGGKLSGKQIINGIKDRLGLGSIREYLGNLRRLFTREGIKAMAKGMISKEALKDMIRTLPCAATGLLAGTITAHHLIGTPTLQKLTITIDPQENKIIITTPGKQTTIGG